MIKKLFRGIGCIALLLSTQSCFNSISNSENISLNPKSIKIDRVEELYHFLTYDENRFPLISALRGGPQEGFPENALETFDFQAQKQPLIIACDIRMTKDSVLVLMHDETLNRTSNGKGYVADYSFEELQQFTLKDPEGTLTSYKIPKLGNVLRWGKGKVLFTLAIHGNVPFNLVAEVINRTQSEGIAIISTTTADQAQKIYQTAPQLMIAVEINTAEDLQRISEKDIPDNHLIAFVGSRLADKSLYDLLHRHGIMCIFEASEDLDARVSTKGTAGYTQLIDQGIDIISTKLPIEAGKAVNLYRLKNHLNSNYIR